MTTDSSPLCENPTEGAREPSTKGLSLDDILGENHERLAPSDGGASDEDLETLDERVVTEEFCVECEDQPSQLHCETCAENFCEVCFSAQHRKGSRRKHVVRPLTVQADSMEIVQSTAGTAGPVGDESQMSEGEELVCDAEREHQDSVEHASKDLDSPFKIGSSVGDWFSERAKYIPVRLTLSERKYLRLLEAALNVSEYTDKIDTLGSNLPKAKRVVHQIRELCAIISGLVLSSDYKKGQELFSGRDFEKNAEFYQQIFELGLRHKIMNPDKMRSTYGKLVYLLQDSQSPQVKELLNFSCVRPIRTVYAALDEHDALDLLQDERIVMATKEIYAEGRTRPEIQRDIRSKERAIEALAARYERNGLSRDQIRQCLYSLGDNNAFLRANRDPCDRLIVYLKEYFHSTEAQDNKSNLAIRRGKGGARLSHDHSTQYAYVLQSLTLWREILHDMFRLWSLAGDDLLSERIPYRLRDTGQGLNRVQPAPKTSRAMYAILNKAQERVGSWIGSSVIHMGDHNVPNALMFIDKYTQIYRILLPICNTLAQIPILAIKPALRSYIDDEFGSTDNLVREILCDFFRHGFDGSGADNFFDAGSCIDGRLTSAWNWCSTIEKKRFYHIFLLTGFMGFDGHW